MILCYRRKATSRTVASQAPTSVYRRRSIIAENLAFEDGDVEVHRVGRG